MYILSMAIIKQLDNAGILHAVVEKKCRELGYGQATFNVVVKNGVPDISTLTYVLQKRKKY